MMRHTMLAALAFAISCAPTSRRAYRDGVEVAPAAEFAPPGYAPAGAGLPEYVPGPPVPSVPRGKDRRVLPPTSEPGVWASDRPPRQFRTRKFTFGTSDYEYPMPDEPEPMEEDRVRDCSRAVYRSAGDSGTLDKIMSLSMIQRRCVLSRLFETCSRYGISKAEEITRAANLERSGKEMAWMRVKQVATMDAKSACALAPDADKLAPIIQALTAAFESVKAEFIHT